MQVRIDKDSEKMWSAFSVLERDGNFYGVLTFDNSMIRYASERFLNIELILEDECGLKIPKSAVVEEQFFVIPHDYITNGGNSSLEGVMVLDSKGTASFQAVDIYDTSDDGEVYLSRDQLKSGTVIVKPDSSDTYTIDTQKPLKGVYNINKGYAILKKYPFYVKATNITLFRKEILMDFLITIISYKTEPVFPLMMLYFSDLIL